MAEEKIDAEIVREIEREEHLRDLLCPISMTIMQDPVVAADGMSYEKENIVKWILTKKELHKPVTSPLHGNVLTNYELVENISLRNLCLAMIEQRKVVKTRRNRFRNGNKGHQNNIILSSQIFNDLDSIIKTDLFKNLKLQSPQIVAIGDESAGKSTLLERLIGFTIFPRDRRVCTRCAIRVHLRHGEAKSPTVCVVNRHTKEVVAGSSNLVSLINIASVIREEMNKIIAEENSYISLDKEIMVEIQLPWCPNLDLVDLPGLVTLNAANSKLTVDLVKSVVEEGRDNSLFLLIVDVDNVNNSKSVALVNELNLNSRTIGVLAKLDRLELRDIVGVLKDNNQKLKLRCDWFTASSKDPIFNPTKAKANNQNNLNPGSSPVGAVPDQEVDRIEKMDQLEAEFLDQMDQDGHRELNILGWAGIAVIKEKLIDMFEEFIVDSWVNSLRDAILDKYDDTCVTSLNMGYPIPANVDYEPKVASLLIQMDQLGYSKYRDVLDVETAEQFKAKFDARVAAVGNSLEWMKLGSLDTIWTSLKTFEDYIATTSESFKQTPIAFELSTKKEAEYEEEAVEVLENFVQALFDPSSKFPTKFVEALVDDAGASIIFGKPDFLVQLRSRKDALGVAKWIRFSKLLTDFKSHIGEKIDAKMLEFKQKAMVLVSQVKGFGYIREKTKRSDAGIVQCHLEWSQSVSDLPHILFNLWRQSIQMDYKSIASKWEMKNIDFVEDCKADRIPMLDELKLYGDALNSLIYLEVKVIKGKREEESTKTKNGNNKPTEINPLKETQQWQLAEFLYWSTRGVALFHISAQNQFGSGYLVAQENNNEKVTIREISSLSDEHLSAKFAILDSENGVVVIYSFLQKGFIVLGTGGFEIKPYNPEITNLRSFDVKVLPVEDAARFKIGFDKENPKTLTLQSSAPSSENNNNNNSSQLFGELSKFNWKPHLNC